MTYEEQWNLQGKDFYSKVKCCANCQNWEIDPCLIFEYAYNTCKHDENKDKVIFRSWDGYCQKYKKKFQYRDIRLEENLIANNRKKE